MILMVLLHLLTPAAAQPETCARVEQDRRQEERSVVSRVDQLKRQEQDEVRAGRSELERNVKFLEFQNELEALEQRYQSRRANCTKTG